MIFAQKRVENSLTIQSQKLPAGIYVPSMVVGGLMGRIVGHGVQYIVLRYPETAMFGDCAAHASQYIFE